MGRSTCIIFRESSEDDAGGSPLVVVRMIYRILFIYIYIYIYIYCALVGLSNEL